MSDYKIPDELTYENISRMYPCVKQEYRKTPKNGSSFTSGDIQMVINKLSRSFGNPATLCLNFRVRHAITYGATAPVASANNIAILGNALSYFSQQLVKPVSGQWQDTISYPGLISNVLMNMTTDPFEKQGMVSMGFNGSVATSGYSNVGDIVTSVTTTANATEYIYCSYSVPILGILNTNKLIPLFCDDIEIDFTINNQVNFLLSFIATANAIYAGFQIEDVEIVMDTLTLEETGFNALISQYPNGMSIKSESYLYGSSSLPATGLGTYDITYSHGLNSLKKFIWWSSPANSWELLYGGVNPNLQNYQLFIGSTAYPQLAIKSYSAAEVYYQLSKSFGAFISTSHSGSINKQSLIKCSLPLAGSKFTQEYVAYIAARPTTFDTAATSIYYPNNASKYYNSLDVEVINQLKNSIYSGISTKGSSNLLRVTIGAPLAAQIHNITFYSVYDSVITFDWQNGAIYSST